LSVEVTPRLGRTLKLKRASPHTDSPSAPQLPYHVCQETQYAAPCHKPAEPLLEVQADAMTASIKHFNQGYRSIRLSHHTHSPKRSRNPSRTLNLILSSVTMLKGTLFFFFFFLEKTDGAAHHTPESALQFIPAPKPWPRLRPIILLLPRHDGPVPSTALRDRGLSVASCSPLG